MLDSFDAVRRGLAKAARRKGEFESAANAFLNSKPFAVVHEEEGVGFDRFLFVKVKQVRDFPDEAADLAGDVIDTLRSVLDHACYASACALGVKDPKYSNFPFAGSKDDLENSIKGRAKDLHPDIISLLRTYHPYEAGNNLLWRLNQSRVQGQHKYLVEGGCAVGGHGLRNVRMSSMNLSLLNKPWDARKKEIKIVKMWAGDAEFEGEVVWEPYIRFSDAGALTGYAVQRTLDDLSGMIRDIAAGIEAETERIIER